jgi:hypothetical protein
VRIRIALSTAVAVIITTGAFFVLLGSSPAASSARFISHPKVHTSGTTHFVFSHIQLTFDSTPITTVATTPAAATPTPATTVAAPVVAPAPAVTPAPVVAPPPVAPPAPVASDANSVDTADWACIRWHESRDNYTDGNGGAYQFEQGTWTSDTGLTGPPEDYPPAVQDAAALKLYRERGWEPWSTRYDCGL